jgi:hypothetical protein
MLIITCTHSASCAVYRSKYGIRPRDACIVVTYTIAMNSRRTHHFAALRYSQHSRVAFKRECVSVHAPPKPGLPDPDPNQPDESGTPTPPLESPPPIRPPQPTEPRPSADFAMRDAAVLAAAQRVEHYEIAAYGCAREFAELLGEMEVAALLQQSL